MTDSYIIFEDEQIKLRIPRQLRAKHADTAYSFKGFLKRGQKESRFEFILILNPPKGMRKAILNAPSHVKWMGAEIETIRKGKCAFGDSGVEVLLKHTNPITVFYRWTVLYRLRRHHLYIDLRGGSDLNVFEKMGTAIIESIAVK